MDKNKSFLKQSRKSENGETDIEFSNRMRFANPLPEPYIENINEVKMDRHSNFAEDRETPKASHSKPPNSSPLRSSPKRSSPLRWPVRESLERVKTVGSEFNT